MPYTTADVAQKLVKKVNTKKASGFDKIPPKINDLDVGVLATPLSKTKNNSILNGVFPNKGCPSISP